MDDDFGLKSDTIQKIQFVLSTNPHISRVLVYGSRAQGTQKNGSDIDLVLIGENGLVLDELLKMKSKLDDLNLPYSIDLSLWDRITNPDLREHIQRVGKVFYERVH